jgi:CheY-like chemotaxis protein
LRVLVVDDDEDTREIYGCSLRAAGWDVEAVTNGREALFVAAAFAPDIIVMDLRMPELGGFETTRRLKKNAHTKHVPILVCSGLDPDRVEAPAREAGCDEFVAKPCTPDTLRTILEGLVVGRHRPAS